MAFNKIAVNILFFPLYLFLIFLCLFENKLYAQPLLDLEIKSIGKEEGSLSGNDVLKFIDLESNEIFEKSIIFSVEKNPKVMAAAAKLKKSSIEIDFEKSAYYPSVQTSFGSGSLGNAGLGYEINMRQMLYDWGAVKSKVDKAKAGERLSIQEFLFERENAAIETIEVYYDYLLADGNVKIISNFIDRLKVVEALSRRRVDAAYIDRSEISRVLFEMERAKDQLIIERNKSQEALDQYRFLVGMPLTPKKNHIKFSLKEDIFLNRNIYDLIKESPLYLQAVEKKNIEEKELSSAIAQLKPQLNLEAASLRREIGGQSTKDSTISLQLRMPVMQGAGGFRRLDAMREGVVAAEWNIQAVSQEIYKNIILLKDKEAPLAERINSMKSQVNNSQEISLIYGEQFFLGMRNINDLITIEISLHEARRQLYQIENEKDRLIYRVLSHLGKLIPYIEDGFGKRL